MRPIHGAKRNMLQLAPHNSPEIDCMRTGPPDLRFEPHDIDRHTWSRFRQVRSPTFSSSFTMIASETVNGTPDAAAPAVQDVCVDHGRAHIAVAE